VRKLGGARPEQGVLTSSPLSCPLQPVPTFGPFPEVPEALRRLKNRYEIAIISNTQDHLIE
jgi:hypothetical protein